MSTKEQCEYYDKCGFVSFRKDTDNNYVVPLPENGDCGINIDTCLRVLSIKKPHLNTAPNKIRLDELGPSNTPEFNVGWKK